MWKLSDMIGLFFLIILSWSDIRKRKVSGGVLLLAGMIAVLYQIVDKSMHKGQVLGGMILGILFLAISKVTEEGMGYGDSLGILILGVYLGFWKMLSVLLCSFFLLFCTLIPVLCKKKMSRKAGLAFYPFLTCGYCWVLIAGG